MKQLLVIIAIIIFTSCVSTQKKDVVILPVEAEQSAIVHNPIKQEVIIPDVISLDEEIIALWSSSIQEIQETNNQIFCVRTIEGSTTTSFLMLVSFDTSSDDFFKNKIIFASFIARLQRAINAMLENSAGSLNILSLSSQSLGFIITVPKNNSDALLGYIKNTISDESPKIDSQVVLATQKIVYDYYNNFSDPSLYVRLIPLIDKNICSLSLSKMYCTTCNFFMSSNDSIEQLSSKLSLLKNNKINVIQVSDDNLSTIATESSFQISLESDYLFRSYEIILLHTIAREADISLFISYGDNPFVIFKTTELLKKEFLLEKLKSLLLVKQFPVHSFNRVHSTYDSAMAIALAWLNNKTGVQGIIPFAIDTNVPMKELINALIKKISAM